MGEYSNPRAGTLCCHPSPAPFEVSLPPHSVPSRVRQQTAVVPAISQDLLLDSNAALCNSLCGSLVELHEIHYSNIALGKLFLFPLKSQFFLSPLILWLNQRNSMIFFYEAGKSVGQVEKRKRREKKKKKINKYQQKWRKEEEEGKKLW